jgi:glutathione peroxidase-family protein
VDVNGTAASDVYNFLKVSSGDLSDIEVRVSSPTGISSSLHADNLPWPARSLLQWNFGKFLVSREGKVVKRYPPNVPPKKLMSDIERL